jgi:hypothetical protein
MRGAGRDELLENGPQPLQHVKLGRSCRQMKRGKRLKRFKSNRKSVAATVVAAAADFLIAASNEQFIIHVI